MLYGEIRPTGHFRFVNFGHPPPLVFSAEFNRFMEIDDARMVQFLALGLEIPEDHPDRNKYLSMAIRPRQINSSDVAEITLMNSGDLLFLYTDGVYDGSDPQDRLLIEQVIREHKNEPARGICNAILEYAVKQDHDPARKRRRRPDRRQDCVHHQARIDVPSLSANHPLSSRVESNYSLANGSRSRGTLCLRHAPDPAAVATRRHKVFRLRQGTRKRVPCLRSR